MKPARFTPGQHKLTILHVWATWCPPCVDELPSLNAFASHHIRQDIKFLPIALDRNEISKVRVFYKDNKITKLPIYLDPKMSVFRALETQGLPTTIFLDQNGDEIARVEGPADWQSDDIRTFVDRIVPH